MSYSADIEKLNKLKSSLTDNKSSVDKVDLDGSWKGSAHDKQASNVKNLGSGVDSQISNIDSLITALTAADAYDEAKEEYDTALKNRNGLDSKASDYASAYKSYSDAMDAADKTMTEKQTAAEAAIGAIGDSYESSLSDVSTTDLKNTTFVVLSSAISELAPDVVENKDASPASDWSNLGTNNSGSRSYGTSYSGNYSSGNSNRSFRYTVGTKSTSSKSPVSGDLTSSIDAKSSLTDLVDTEMSGKEITIPDDVKQGGYTVTGYDYWVQSGDVMVWASGTNQEKVSEIWKKQGSRFKNGIAVINVDGEDRYLVAVTTIFGQVGDCIDVKLADGSVVKCIIGDSKGSGADMGSKWGHPLGDGTINVLEFEVQRSTTLELGNPTTEKWGLDWDSSQPVKSIKNLGTIIGAKETDKTVELTKTNNDVTSDSTSTTNNDSTSVINSDDKTTTDDTTDTTNNVTDDDSVAASEEASSSTVTDTPVDTDDTSTDDSTDDSIELNIIDSTSIEI